MAFSGGGSRSFTASIGYLAGLNELGLLGNVRYGGRPLRPLSLAPSSCCGVYLSCPACSYITGISGGSWATAAFSYAGVAEGNDRLLLGDVIFPANLTTGNLNDILPQCLRGAAVNKNFQDILLGKLLNPQVPNRCVCACCACGM